MNKVSRFTLFIFILSLILLLGLVFSGWVVPNIIKPAADTIWLFWRVIILSTGQVYYWVVLCFAVIILTIYRLARVKPAVQPEDHIVKNEAIENLKNWQDFIVSSNHAGGSQDITRDKLLRMVIAHYSNRLPDANQADIVQSLEQRRLSLPDAVHNYLFLPRPLQPKRSLTYMVYQSIHQWYRGVTGGDEAQFNRMIDELVDFLNS